MSSDIVDRLFLALVICTIGLLMVAASRVGDRKRDAALLGLVSGLCGAGAAAGAAL
jgi:uncharacterized membrane protein YadS